MKPILLDQIQPVYSISESGEVFSTIKQRYLKGSINSSGYKIYSLKLIDNSFKWFFAHRLVILAYKGQPTAEQIDVNHIDNDKLNNHYTNLEYCTHSENIQKSYDTTDRRKNLTGMKGHKHNKLTKQLMSEQKNKKVILYQNNQLVKEFNSINDLLNHLQWYRNKYNRLIKGTYKNPENYSIKIV